MLITSVAFAVKTFFTGVFLAMGFAHGYEAGNFCVDKLKVFRDWVHVMLASWPGLRTQLFIIFGRMLPQEQKIIFA